MIEIVFEVLLEFVGEIVLQAALELLFELGLRSLANTVQRPRNPVLSALGFILWGTMAGGISLLIFPISLIADPVLRMVSLCVTPTIVALMMALLGKARLKRGQTLVRLDRFGYAFIFAFCMALVRFTWAG